MSRCFPFPPPGYIRKAGLESADNVESLKQDKHREKDKKEKDREKREGKDRKETDRSDEKHRDKKERKDKHRDKKKDKDRHRDRDKEKKKEKEKEKEREKDHGSSSNDRKLPLQIGLANGDNSSKEKGPAPSVSPGGQTGDISNRKERDRDKHRNSTPDGKKSALQHVRKTILTSDNSLKDANENNKYVQELQKRVSNDRNSGTQLAEKFMVAEKTTDAIVQVLTKPTAGTRPEGKELNKEKRDNERKVERVNGTLKVQNISGIVQSKAQEVSRLLEQNAKGDREWRKKVKGSESEGKRGDKSKDKDGDKKGQGEVELGKYLDEERIREKSERNRHIDQETVMLSRKNDILNSPNSRSLQQPVKEPDKFAAALGNVTKKRKDHDTNGFLHANKIRSNKMPKQSLASNPPLENGRISEHHQSPAQVPPSLPVAPNNSKFPEANKEEKKVNGVTDTHVTRPVSPSNTHLSISQANPLLPEMPLVRSPHPDSKYLNEILSRVPRMEELPELDDDQGWLFDTDCEGSKKSKRGHAVVNEMPQVWGESLHIESADIYALPYVIPY